MSNNADPDGNVIELTQAGRQTDCRCVSRRICGCARTQNEFVLASREIVFGEARTVTLKGLDDQVVHTICW